jgi:hypothetical protein
MASPEKASTASTSKFCGGSRSIDRPRVAQHDVHLGRRVGDVREPLVRDFLDGGSMS